MNTKLSYNNDNSKYEETTHMDYVKCNIREIVPDLLLATQQSVFDCNEAHRLFSPEPMSSWKPSFTKGIFYKECKINPALKPHLTNQGYNVKCISLSYIDIYFAKSNNSTSLGFSSIEQSANFVDLTKPIKLDLNYIVDNDGKYVESFLTCIDDGNTHLFSFSLDVEYQLILSESVKENIPFEPKIQKDLKKDQRRG